MVEDVAVNLLGVLHPKYVLDSSEFIKFLSTNPWELTMMGILWLLLLYGGMYLSGLKFFSSYKEANKKIILNWFLFGVVATVIL